ncbi:hypothetical protein B0O79_1601 [Flavobacteriaceae bacterium MAR_2009_75]|nr:hypothetical protein B0O79_1601 [Flavobacteriaceae bacterium MAR_2009_75]
MKKFILKFTLYVFFIYFLAEVITRLFFLTSELPKRKLWEDGIQKYQPNQSGYWKGGKHKWSINATGWPGPETKSEGSKILIIGDSFIENFMNPDNCRQAYFLKKKMSNYNFIEYGRSGMSFIEALEINKINRYNETNIELSLIYINDNDLTESLVSITRKSDRTQVDLQQDKVLPGKLKFPIAKEILYNFKFVYYLYRRFPVNGIFSKKKTRRKTPKQPYELNKYLNSLLKFSQERYNLNSTIFILRPDTSEEVMDIFTKNGLRYLKLQYFNTKSWSFVDDHHWTCYGHRQASLQIAQYLKNHLSTVDSASK